MDSSSSSSNDNLNLRPINMSVFFNIFVLVFAANMADNRVEALRAFFVFGDSLVDNGNNNFLLTTARADAPPYGIDYPTHQPTGRFSNGRNIPDLISERLGSEPTLPYLSPELKGHKLLVGANFASAGIGILNDTGYQFLGVIRMYRQLEHFKEYKHRVRALIGEEAAQRLVNQSLVLITVGGNDFVNNYYLVPNSKRSQQFSVPDYVRLLISEYRKILLKLYDFGARRIIVTGTGPLGCAPAELVQRGKRSKCLVKLQKAAGLYNRKLLKMLRQLNRDIGTETFVATNTGKMHMNFIENPQAYGFVTSRIACCGQGPFNGVGICNALSNLCPNRDLYVFWDPYHPSERANKMIVEQMFSASTEYMEPMNLSTILELDSRI